MKNNKDFINQFTLSPQAKAGVLAKKLENAEANPYHDNSKPHRDNHFLLLLATHGEFKINVDFKELVFNGASMLLVAPGQVHYTVAMKEAMGWVISFDPLLVAKELEPILEKGFEFPMLLNRKSVFYERATTLIALIEEMQTDTLTVYFNRTIHALVDALLSLISNEISQSINSKIKERRAVIIEQDFKELLKKHYKEWKQPSRYAEELKISLPHLYDTLKEITGNSVTTCIQEYTILEAKRLLYFTELSVKEISYELGYLEPVYFGKLFKKTTGVTPLEFRRKFLD